MGSVLTTGSTVTCGHTPPGKVATTSSAKLTVSGQPVLLVAGVAGQSVACPTVPDPNSGLKPCTTVASASGTANKLTAGGQPVLLDGLSGKTDGTIGGNPVDISATAGQSKLTAS